MRASLSSTPRAPAVCHESVEIRHFGTADSIKTSVHNFSAFLCLAALSGQPAGRPT